MLVLFRALTYATLFIGLLLVFVPDRILAPAGIVRPTDIEPIQITAMLVVVAGAALAIASVLTFAFIGKGTPAPFDPPRKLVVAGPYRWVRNPMYIGAGLVLLGAAMFYGSIGLVLYTIIFWSMAHLFVLFYEEPVLRRNFGADDYESASKAALAGGTTTLIEMICPGASDEPFAAFELWKSKAERLAAVDYTFHMSVVRFEEHIREQFREIVKAGVASFKVFLAYKGALNLSDEDLFAAMKFAKDLGVIVTAHCENADAIDALQKSLLAAGKTGPEWHGPSRDRKSTRLNSSHRTISYAVFCLKKKKTNKVQVLRRVETRPT